jgi:hypothetical protein
MEKDVVDRSANGGICRVDMLALERMSALLMSVLVLLLIKLRI